MSYRAILIGIFLGVIALAAARGDELTSLGLEELMNLKVTSLQRKEQSLARSAAAIRVITREDILRSGVSTLPEALRLAPGLHVARSSANVWAIGSRGFTAQFANKLQVLVDGRSVYLPFNSGVFWESLDLMLDDVERIEVIRGPGAVMWGANAVTGVINIITRRARDTVGTFLEVGSGSEDRVLTRLRVGKQLKDNLAVRFSGQYGNRTPFLDRADSDTGPWTSARGGFRMDWEPAAGGSVLVEADLYQSSLTNEYTVPSRVPGVSELSRARAHSEGGAILGRWVRDTWRGQTTAQMYFSLLDQGRADYVAARTATVDIDLQHRLSLTPKQDLLGAFGHRTTQDETSVTWRAAFRPASRRYDITNFTLQHEYQLAPDRLFLTSGARIEDNTFSGANLQPTVRLLWAPVAEFSIWGAVSRAVRTPSRVEQDMNLIIGGVPELGLAIRKTANPAFRPETLRAYESGARWQFGKRFSIDGAVFQNGYRNLEAWLHQFPVMDRQLGLLLPVQSVNRANGRAYGTEIAATVDVDYRWRIQGSLTQYHSRLEATDGPPVEIRPDVFPRTQIQLHNHYALNRKLQWNTSWYRTGEVTAPGQSIPAYDRVDTSVRWRFSEATGFSAGVQNLTGSQTFQYRPEDGMRPQYMRRLLWARLQWWF